MVAGKESSARFGRNSISGSLRVPSVRPGSKGAVPTSFPPDHPPPRENSSAVPITEAGFHSTLSTEARDLSAAASTKPNQGSRSQQMLILWVYHRPISSKAMQILLVLGLFEHKGSSLSCKSENTCIGHCMC